MDTKVSVLVEQHLALLAEAGKSPATLTTYRSAVRKLAKFTNALRVGDATPGRLNAVVRSMRAAHGARMARHGRTLLRGALQIAVLNDVLGSNPVAQVSRIESVRKPKGAPALNADQLPEPLGRLRASLACEDIDLIDPITLLAATGLRRSELLALRWTDYDERTDTITVGGKVARMEGEGLKRLPSGKTDASDRVVPLPALALAMLAKRSQRAFWGQQAMIFPSSTGHIARPGQLQ
ncbi:tyrosine recombinase XerC [Mycobacterium sp. 1165178.9]|uniref:site-specific integrase n=1 Tax=Mycobacterium sp. 1165178.9 TaxID=1834070 RepID=UPI000800F7F2|nr:tyrosine-type recombinase/integrase [Mycobacterium sp. 1165178.9]OBK88720.1 hypothetical protein A5652_13105 [Mycobacterium sp. 1165178.9]